MNRPIAVVGAPSSIGIRPYDDSNPRRLDLAPGTLRELGLVERLDARDLGDAIPPPYRDFERPPGAVRNEVEVADYARKLAGRVATAVKDHAFVVVLGGDCSIILGSLLGLRRSGHAAPGLAYIDAHSDFGTPELSRSGSAASMCLALAAGRGDTPLAHLENEALVRERDVAVIGRRDDADTPIYGQHLLRASPILDLNRAEVRARGAGATAAAAVERLEKNETGFLVHLDADALDPTVMPAVDTPEPDGLTLDEIGTILEPLVRHPKALGLQLTIYDPTLDPDRAAGKRLVSLVSAALRGSDRRPRT